MGSHTYSTHWTNESIKIDIEGSLYISLKYFESLVPQLIPSGLALWPLTGHRQGLRQKMTSQCIPIKIILIGALAKICRHHIPSSETSCWAQFGRDTLERRSEKYPILCEKALSIHHSATYDVIVAELGPIVFALGIVALHAIITEVTIWVREVG